MQQLVERRGADASRRRRPPGWAPRTTWRRRWRATRAVTARRAPADRHPRGGAPPGAATPPGSRSGTERVSTAATGPSVGVEPHSDVQRPVRAVGEPAGGREGRAERVRATPCRRARGRERTTSPSPLATRTASHVARALPGHRRDDDELHDADPARGARPIGVAGVDVSLAVARPVRPRAVEGAGVGATRSWRAVRPARRLPGARRAGRARRRLRSSRKAGGAARRGPPPRGDATCVVFTAPVKTGGWTFAAVAPKDEILASVARAAPHADPHRPRCAAADRRRARAGRPAGS